MANFDGNELGAIIEIFGRLSRNLRWYEGEVLDNFDVFGGMDSGRVKVAIPQLGFTDGIWAKPIFNYSLIVPVKGESVFVGFLWGKPEGAVYFGRTGILKASRLAAYKKPDTAVLFEDDGTDPLTCVWNRDTLLLDFFKQKSGEDVFRYNLDLTKKFADLNLGAGKGFDIKADWDKKLLTITIGENPDIVITMDGKNTLYNIAIGKDPILVIKADAKNVLYSLQIGKDKDITLDLNGKDVKTNFKDKNNNKIDITDGGIAVQDKNSNKVEMVSSGITVTDKSNNKIEMSSSGTTIQDKNSNKIEMTSSGMNLSISSGAKIQMGASGIVLQGAAGKLEVM